MTKSRPYNPARQLAAVLSAFVVGVLALVAPLTSAGAAGPWSTAVSVTAASQAGGLTLKVDGSGYVSLPNASTGAPNAGVYVALRDPATMSNAEINADNGIVPALTFLPKMAMPTGDWTVGLNAAAVGFDVDAAWEIIVWSAHGNITDGSLIDTVPMNLTDAQKQALDPSWTPPTTTSTPAPSTPTTEPSQTTTTGPATTTPSDSTMPPTTTAPTTTARPTTTRPSTPATNPPATTPGGPHCVTEAVPGTTGAPQLSWGVKSSFVNYIESNVAKGQIDTGGGVSRTGAGFTWTNGSGSLDESGQGTWSFAGFVHFTGHDDVLNVTLSNLRVRVDGPNSGMLIADIDSHDMDGNDVGGKNIEMATLAFSSVSAAGGTATAAFTAAGARAFAGFYEAGEALDPLTVTASSTGSGTVETCYDADGNVVSTTETPGGSGGLAATGADTAGLIGVGTLLIALGGLAWMTASRRRRASASIT